MFTKFGTSVREENLNCGLRITVNFFYCEVICTMDQPKGLNPRWGKRYFRSGVATSKDEAKYLLDEHDTEDNDAVFTSLRGRKARDGDFEDDNVLISVPGRPPTRPPNDQCVEAEIQPDDTLASISLKVQWVFVLFYLTFLTSSFPNVSGKNSPINIY